ncbi:HAD-IC family P-type ATPase, partial [Actinomycetospora chlora]|uniref:HAD-IC family P-type ATPase n=1 Tax=Actinomycetospora chlora TaxID=663608 RepID=UPI0031F0101D
TVDTVVFDKTGTLTRGEPTVVDLRPVAGRDGDELLALAAAAEADSEHPLARAIVAAAAERGIEPPSATGFSSSPAVGVSADVGGRQVRVGGPRLLDETGLDALAVAHTWGEDGATVLHVVVDGRVLGALALADAVRSESREAVAELHRRGLRVVMATGDSPAVAQAVARDLEVDRVFAGVRPEDKATTVATLQDEGHRVAMVGDGVNDAPALARADVGLAIGAGTDVAIGSAGVVLAGDDPRAVTSVIDLSRASYRKMAQNLWWAAGYNLVSVPLAAGVLAPLGVVLPMSVGAVLMSVSTVVVALNAQLLRRLDLRPGSSDRRADGDSRPSAPVAPTSAARE